MAFNITSNVLGALNTIANIGTEKKVAEQTKQEREISGLRAAAEGSAWDIQAQTQSEALKKEVSDLETKMEANEPKFVGRNAKKKAEEYYKSFDEPISELTRRAERWQTNQSNIVAYMNYFKEKGGKS